METIEQVGSVTTHAGRVLEAAFAALEEERHAAPGQLSDLDDVSDRVAAAARCLAHAGESDDTSARAAARELLDLALARARSMPLPDSSVHWMEALERVSGLLDESAAVSTPPAPVQDDSDRRAHPRVHVEREVSFESEHNFYTGFTEDISEGGLFIATYELQPIGTHVNLQFTLPGDHVVQLTGTVRWHRDPRHEEPGAPTGMGIQFDHITEEDKEGINMFIETRGSLFYED